MYTDAQAASLVSSASFTVRFRKTSGCRFDSPQQFARHHSLWRHRCATAAHSPHEWLLGRPVCRLLKSATRWAKHLTCWSQTKRWRVLRRHPRQRHRGLVARSWQRGGGRLDSTGGVQSLFHRRQRQATSRSHAHSFGMGSGEPVYLSEDEARNSAEPMQVKWSVRGMYGKQTARVKCIERKSACLT